MEQIILKADINTCRVEGWDVNTGEINARSLSVEMCDKLCSCAMAFVTFELKDGTIYESLVVDGKAEIPQLEEPQFIKVGLYSADIVDEKCEKRYSPKPDNVYVNRGSYSGNGTEPPIPTPGTLEEIIGLIKSNSGLSLDDVLQEINNATNNEPQKTYSANVINREIVAPVTDHITRLWNIVEANKKALDGLGTKEDISNKVDEIVIDDLHDGEYPTTKAVYNFGGLLYEHIVNEINGNLNEVSALIGGAE